jgi:hypothetical protein
MCGKYHEECDRRSPPQSVLGPRTPRIPEMCNNRALLGASVCLKPSACDFCHTEEEFYAIYKTKPCWRFRTPEGCNRPDTCGFYHEEEERRWPKEETLEEEEEEEQEQEEEPFTLFQYGTSWVYFSV